MASMTRRTFVATSGLLAAGARAASRSELRYAEVEARIARRDFRGITKDDLGTPAMILELGLFEKNLAAMAAHSKATGLQIRPHVKIHKCPEVSKRQLAVGATGVCCATIAECELMHAHGIRNILWTGQAAGRNKIGRAAALARRDATFTCVADDPLTVDWLNDACAAAGSKLNILVDVYAGLTRQGCQPG